MLSGTRPIRLLSAFSEKTLTRAVLRFPVAALLVSFVICVATPGPARSQAPPQLSYTVASFNAGTNPAAAKVADLDGDGRNDIAVVNRQGDLQLFFNNGGGSFQRVSLNGLWPSSANPRRCDWRSERRRPKRPRRSLRNSNGRFVGSVESRQPIVRCSGQLHVVQFLERSCDR